MARTNGSDVVAIYVELVNETIDLHESRVTAGIYARVPETVLLLLVGGAALSLGMVGYSAGLTRRRSLLSAVVLVLALGAVIMIVIDLDRPREGFIQVSQQPLSTCSSRSVRRPADGVPRPPITARRAGSVLGVG